MKRLLLFIYMAITVSQLSAQNVTITPNGITPATHHPRLSYDAIRSLPDPKAGDIAYDLTFNCLRVYTGTQWLCTYQHPGDNTPNVSLIGSAGSSSVETEAGYGVATDASGFVYVTGVYYGLVNFGSNTLISAGGADIFVAKYSKDGDLLWAKSGGGPQSDQVHDIAVDGSGNVYITGGYFGTATFGTAPPITSAGSYDIFVAKYNTNGEIQWLNSAGGAEDDMGRGIAVGGSQDDVYVTGSYRHNATFGGSPTSTVNGYHTYIAKYNNAGNFQWVNTETGADYDSGLDIAVDGSGYLYITGMYSGTINLGNITLTAAGSMDTFIAKYDGSSNWEWAQSVGGTGIDIGAGIALGENSAVYVTGSFEGNATFGNTSRTSAGQTDIYLIKYTSGGTFQWVQQAGGPSFDYGSGIDVDIDNNVFITGAYTGNATFGGVPKISEGVSDIFAARYSNSGTLLWIQSAGGSLQDFGQSISSGPSGNVYVTGSFGSTATFGNTTKLSNGGGDIFLIRLNK